MIVLGGLNRSATGVRVGDSCELLGICWCGAKLRVKDAVSPWMRKGTE